jgi:ATP-dependent helicase/nuclease subunit B
MPVQFVLGRAGTGKTRQLLNEITALVKTDPLGEPIFWVLPRQATFQTERLLTVTLGAFSRVRVVSFDQLGKDILTHCGELGIPEVTAVGRRMVIGHLLRRNQKQLKYYSNSAHRPGLAAELDATFGEFDRAGLDATALDQLCNSFHADDTAAPDLASKLADINLLLSQYNSYIGQDRLDPQRRLALILQRAGDCALLKNARFFIDDFYDFTGHERKLLTAVAGSAARTVISLLIDPDSSAVQNPGGIPGDLSIFHRTERTYTSLLKSLKESGVKIDLPILLRSTHRCESADLSALEQHFFSSSPASAPATAIQAVETCDQRSEVDVVAGKIKSAVAGGLRYRQIGVLVRDLDKYQSIIDASFTEHGLPYFADHRRGATHHPLLALVRSALVITRQRWPHEAVMALVKSGLTGLSDDQADELENYVLKHRIRGRKWESHEPWAFQRDLIRAEDQPPELTQGNPVDLYRRSLQEKLEPLLELGRTTKPWPIREIAARVFAVLDGFGVRTILAEWMNQAEQAGELERRSEHEQVWAEFVGLFDHLVDLLGDELISLADFASVLDSGLDRFDLALVPQMVDQIVVGQIDRTRAPDLKLVFVLGMNEGSFPHVTSERCVISDRERRVLRARHIDLDPDSERHLLDERFLAYLAFTRASQRLVLTRPTAGAKGRATNPSIFWTEVLRLLPTIAIEKIPRSKTADPLHIGTPRQLVTSLLRWVREGAYDSPAGSPNDAWPSLYQWLASHPAGDRVATMRDQAWGSLRYDNAAHLQPPVARQLFASPLYGRVAQLESMAACPFQHFSRYGLRLYDRDRTEVTNLDLSNAYHDILENLVRDLLETAQDWCAMKPAEAKEMIRIHAEEIGRRLRGELMLSTSRNRYLLDRIQRTLEQALATMIETSRRGKYRPQHAGIEFGDGAKLPAYEVPTPSGGLVKLRGKIDRVDINDRQTAFVVSDYRMSAGPLQLDRVYHGLSLQLLTYLLVIQANGQQLVGKKLTPAAAFVLKLLRSPQAVDHPSEALLPTDPKFHLQTKPRGVIERRALNSIDLQLTEGASEVVAAYVKKEDGGIGLRNSTDVAEQAEFEALLHLVRTRLGELADEILTGNVAVSPFMIGRQTPCPHCAYRSVCRFEPNINRYRMLKGMKREEVLDAVKDQR